MVASAKVLGSPPIAVVETRAALEGLILAQEKGCLEVVLEGDCYQVCLAIRARKRDPHVAFGALVAKILTLSSSFMSFN